MTIILKTKSLIARLAAFNLNTNRMAITFGNTIHLWNVSREEFLADKKWICHELTHVKQYREHGFITFIIKYLMESIKHGYYNNKFEREARENETNFELLKDVQFN